VDSVKTIPLSQYTYIPQRSALLPGVLSATLLFYGLYLGQQFGSTLKIASQQQLLEEKLNSQMPIAQVMELAEIRTFAPELGISVKLTTNAISALEESNFVNAREIVSSEGFPKHPTSIVLLEQLKQTEKYTQQIAGLEKEKNEIELRHSADSEALQGLYKELHRFFRNPNLIQSSSSNKQDSSISENAFAITGQTVQFYQSGVLTDLPQLPWLPENLQSEDELKPYLRLLDANAELSPESRQAIQAHLAELKQHASRVKIQIERTETKTSQLQSKKSQLLKDSLAVKNEIIVLTKGILFEIVVPRPIPSHVNNYQTIRDFLDHQLHITLPELRRTE